jgi:hypothetical protein
MVNNKMLFNYSSSQLEILHDILRFARADLEAAAVNERFVRIL